MDSIPELKDRFLPCLFLTPQELIRPGWFSSNQAIEVEGGSIEGAMTSKLVQFELEFRAFEENKFEGKWICRGMLAFDFHHIGGPNNS